MWAHQSAQLLSAQQVQHVPCSGFKTELAPPNPPQKRQVIKLRRLAQALQQLQQLPDATSCVISLDNAASSRLISLQSAASSHASGCDQPSWKLQSMGDSWKLQLRSECRVGERTKIIFQLGQYRPSFRARGGFQQGGCIAAFHVVGEIRSSQSGRPRSHLFKRVAHKNKAGGRKKPL